MYVIAWIDENAEERFRYRKDWTNELGVKAWGGTAEISEATQFKTYDAAVTAYLSVYRFPQDHLKNLHSGSVRIMPVKQDLLF